MSNTSFNQPCPVGAIRFMKRWIIGGIAILTFLSIVLSASIIYSVPNARGVQVTAVSSNGVRYRPRGSRRDISAAPGNSLTNPNERLILLANSNSRLTMQSIPLPGQRSYIFNASSGNVQAQFIYPCNGNPPSIISWSAGNRDDCSPPGFVVNSTRVDTRQASAHSITTAQAKETLTAQNPFQDLFRQLSPAIKVEYCSYVEDGGTAWSAKSAIAGTADPCRQAQNQCLRRASPGDDCFVASTGEWQLANRELVFSLDCADNRSFKTTSPGTAILGTLVLQIDEIARRIGGSACVLNVFPPGAMIIAPATDQPTIVQTRALGGTIAVDALLGSVVIRAAETPQGEPLILPEGSTYQGGGYDGTEYYGGYLTDQTAEDVWTNPTMQGVLTADDSFQVGNGVSREDASEMAAQQQAFQQTLQAIANSQNAPPFAQSPTEQVPPTEPTPEPLLF